MLLSDNQTTEDMVNASMTAFWLMADPFGVTKAAVSMWSAHPVIQLWEENAAGLTEVIMEQSAAAFLQMNTLAVTAHQAPKSICG